MQTYILPMKQVRHITWVKTSNAWVNAYNILWYRMWFYYLLPFLAFVFVISYCLLCGALGHVHRWYKTRPLQDASAGHPTAYHLLNKSRVLRCSSLFHKISESDVLTRCSYDSDLTVSHIELHTDYKESKAEQLDFFREYTVLWKQFCLRMFTDKNKKDAKQGGGSVCCVLFGLSRCIHGNR